MAWKGSVRITNILPRLPKKRKSSRGSFAVPSLFTLQLAAYLIFKELRAFRSLHCNYIIAGVERLSADFAQNRSAVLLRCAVALQLHYNRARIVVRKILGNHFPGCLLGSPYLHL